MSKSEEAMHGITFKDKIGYAMGDMGGLLTFGLVSAFLNMFYTDVVGISAARITVLMIFVNGLTIHLEADKKH